MRFEFGFSSFCQASLITFVGVFNVLWGDSTFFKIFHVLSIRWQCVDPIRYSVKAA